MAKIETVFLLVQSLSKAEKRYFRLQSNLQAGDKSYYELYELLASNHSCHEVTERFKKSHTEKNIEMAARHLYKVLMDCLIYLREKQSIETKIFNHLSKAGILVEREMVDEAFNELDKACQLAVKYEKDLHLLLIQRTELHYLSMLDFPAITEKELVNKQVNLNEGIKNIRHANKHVQLYDILKHRLLYKGYVRSDKQKSELNDLVLSELYLLSNCAPAGFENKKLHLLFQATYFLHCGNHQAALKYYKELIELFEKNPHLILNPPVYYFSVLLGILDSLLIERLYHEMPYFIDRIEDIEQNEKYSNEYRLYAGSNRFLYTLNVLLHTGRFNEAGRLIENSREKLFRKINLTGLNIQLALYTSLITYAMYTGDLAAARKEMRKITGAGKSFHNLPGFQVIRLINLLLQIENNNYDWVTSQINSIKWKMRIEKQPFGIEKLIFRFVKAYPLPFLEKARLTIWNQLQKEVTRINRSTYERQLLKTFDFIAWIESRLKKVSLEEIINKT